MEILINELSIKGQFASVEEFIESGVSPFVDVLNEIDKSQDLLYKKYDFYNALVTPDTSIHDVFKGHLARQYDVVRKFKSLLVSLFENPYWEDNQKHSVDDEYLHNGISISGSSLAESCERDKIVISMLCDGFNTQTINVTKEDEEINIDNLYNTGQYDTVARERGLIVDFSLEDTDRYRKTSIISQGQSVYNELSSGFYWCLDNLHKDHYEVYDSTKKHLGVADLEGNIDRSKKVNGRKL